MGRINASGIVEVDQLVPATGAGVVTLKEDRAAKTYRVLLRMAPFGFSAVAIGRPSCTAVSSTGTAFPCPPGLDPTRSAGITPPSGTTRSSDFCWAIEPSSSRPPAYRPSRTGAQQISWGEMLRFRCDHVANTLPVTTYRDRASPPLAGSPTRQRLTALHSRSPPQRIYGLLQTRPRGSFAAQPAALKPPGQFRAAPLPHRCRVPSVRAPGQDFHLRSQHPYPAHQGRRFAARFARPCRAALDCRLAPAGWQ